MEDLQFKTNRKSYMVYQMAATAVTLNDLEGRSPVTGFFKCNPSNICAHFTRFQLTLCSRSLFLSSASCMNRDTMDKRIVYARNTETG